MGLMSFFEYLWDDRANCLLVWVEDPDAVDVVTVEWLTAGEYTTIGIGVHGHLSEGLFGIFAVSLPPNAGDEPVILTVNGVREGQAHDGHDNRTLSERITLDAHAKLQQAERMHWFVTATDQGPIHHCLPAEEKVPPNTISTIMASPRYGNTIGPAENATGEGQGGTLRVKVFHSENVEGGMEVEVFAPEGQRLPETHVSFCTLSAVDHVLPALESGHLDLGVLSNHSTAVLGSYGMAKHSHIFEAPGAHGQVRHLSYMDRMAIVTSPPATLVFERSATQASAAGKSGALALVNGMGNFPYVDDGTLLDIIIAAQPKRSEQANADIIRAYGDAGKPMQLSDLDFANEITASVYSELSYLITRRHGANAAQLTPVDINQFLKAPSYFGILAALDASRLALNAARRLNASLATGGDAEVLKTLVSIVLNADIKTQPRIQIWLDQIQGHDAYRAGTLPFFSPTLDVITAGIDPTGIDLAEVERLTSQIDLAKRQQTLDALTNAGVLESSFEHQFKSVLSDDLETYESDLQKTVNATVEVCQQAWEVSGLYRNQQFEPRDLLNLAEATPPAQSALKTKSQNRAFHWLAAKLNSQLGDSRLPPYDLPVTALLARMASKLYQDFREDFEKIESIVRSCQLIDPIQLDQGKVVSFSPSRNYEMDELPSPFMHPPSHDTMAWLEADQNDPDLIAQWKGDLRRQVLKQQKPKNQDPMGA